MFPAVFFLIWGMKNLSKLNLNLFNCQTLKKKKKKERLHVLQQIYVLSYGAFWNVFGEKQNDSFNILQQTMVGIEECSCHFITLSCLKTSGFAVVYFVFIKYIGDLFGNCFLVSLRGYSLPWFLHKSFEGYDAKKPLLVTRLRHNKVISSSWTTN